MKIIRNISCLLLLFTWRLFSYSKVLFICDYLESMLKINPYFYYLYPVFFRLKAYL